MKRMICKPTKKKLFLLIFSLSCIICLILLVIFPKNKYLIAEKGIANPDIEISNTSLGSLSEPDISLIPERKFVENEFGEKILMEKEYFAKYFGTTTDTWKWIDEKGEIQQKEVRNSIEWESDGTPNPFELAGSEYRPSFEDEIGPSPVSVNATMVKLRPDISFTMPLTESTHRIASDANKESIFSASVPFCIPGVTIKKIAMTIMTKIAIFLFIIFIF